MNGVIIGLPCYGKMDPETAVSLLRLYDRGRDFIQGVVLNKWLYIDRARNKVAREALEHPTATHLLWLDIDHTWPAELIPALLSRGKAVVGANYFLKTPPFDMAAGNFTSATTYRRLQALPRGLTRVDVLGMGATLTRLDVLRAMREKYGDELWFRSEETGEDFWFFRRLKEMGVEAFLDGNLVCQHLAELPVGEEQWRANHLGV